MSAADIDYRERDIVLVRSSLQASGEAACKVPTNLGDHLYSAGVMAGIASTVGPFIFLPLPIVPISPLAAAIAWGINDSTVDVKKLKEMKEGYKNLHFKDSDQRARIGIAFDVVALQQEGGSRDIAVSAKVVYASDFRFQADEPVLASMYRDMASFSILPDAATASAGWKRNNGAMLPPTVNRSTNYSYSTSWTVGGGFTGTLNDKPSIGFSGNGTYSFGVTAERPSEDFETVRNTTDASEMAAWTSTMRTISDNGVPRLYNYSQPECIVAHTIFTKWLCSPPDTARHDLDLAYFAGFTQAGRAAAGETLRFHFTGMQRLMHAQVFGRTGAMAARIGGAAGVIPGLFTVAGDLVIDLAGKRVRIENQQVAFRAMPDAIDEIIRLSER